MDLEIWARQKDMFLIYNSLYIQTFGYPNLQVRAVNARFDLIFLLRF
jgi:hypothetical protein